MQDNKFQNLPNQINSLEAIQNKGQQNYLHTKLLWTRWNFKQGKTNYNIDNHINLAYSFSICSFFLNFAFILSSLIGLFKEISKSFLLADFSLTQSDFISSSTYLIDLTPGRRNSKLYPESDYFIVYEISLFV